MQNAKEHLRNSIVRIQGKSRGVGFWVKGRNNEIYILSCTHVAGEKGDQADIWFHDGNKQYLTEKNNPVRVEVLFSIPVKEGDIALMSISEAQIPPDALPLQVLNICFDTPPTFIAYGFPESFSEHGRFAENTNQVGEIVKSSDEVPLLHLIDAGEIRKGFSGGPLVHADMGYVLGMISDLETPNPDFATTIPYALPASFLSEKLNDYLDIQTLHPYKAWLASLYHEVVLNDEKGMRLSDIFIEPDFGIFESCIKDHPDFEKKSFPNGFYPINHSIQDFALKLLSGQLTDHILSNQFVLSLILGYPGQGKTSFTKRLLHDLIASDPDSDIYMIRLRHISDARKLRDDPMGLIESEICRQAEIEASIILSDISLKNAVVVLDGLDELTIKGDLDSKDVDSIVAEIARISTQYQGLRIVLTSRYGYVNLEKMANHKSILLLQLAEITLTQQKQWLHCYRSFHSESQLTEEKLILYHTDEKYTSLKELISQPILLHLVAALEEDLIYAENRAAIYTKLFDQLVNRPWSKEGATAPLLNNRSIPLREAIQDMAHAIFHSEKGYLYKSALDKLPKVLDLQKELDNNLDIWRSVMVAFYMDEKRKVTRNEDDDDRNHDYAIEFLHKSLPEYLCAEKIWRSIKDGFEGKPKKMEYDLDVLNEVFGRKIITIEITKYLIEIIKNDQNANKPALTTRLLHFLDDYFLADFLHIAAKYPIDSICAVFYGYWTILSHIWTAFPDFDRKKTEALGRLVRIVGLDHMRYFNLGGAILESVSLRGVRLVSVRLVGADLSGADLMYADLEYANMENSYLEAINLSGANLVSANLQNVFLLFGNLSGADLGKANLLHANLENSNLTYSRMVGAHMVSANLQNASLSRSILAAANLKDANLRNANLGYTDLRSAKLKYADLRNADLRCVYLEGAYLEGANLEGAKLIGTILGDNIGLTLEQLQTVSTLYNCTGIIPDWEESLRISHPYLFEIPERKR
jgi:uncharacterized protein YjbI with pentapeptide repeats